MIRELCENPSDTWTPGSGKQKGEALKVPDAGPLLTPYDASLVGTSSVDLRVGTIFSSPSSFEAWVMKDKTLHTRIGYRHKIDKEDIPAKFRDEDFGLGNKGGLAIGIKLDPGSVLACVSAEYARIPPHVQGKLYVRSSPAREWIDHSNATLVHPGFQGNITYEIRNDGPRPYIIHSGMRLIQMTLELMAAVPEEPYFARASAKYKGQMNVLHSLERSA